MRKILLALVLLTALPASAQMYPGLRPHDHGSAGQGGNTLSAPTVTGHPTIEGVTSTGATGTGKFVFDAAPTITGHATIEGVTATGATGTGKFVFDTSPTFQSPVGFTGAATFNNGISVTAAAPITAQATFVQNGTYVDNGTGATYTVTVADYVIIGSKGTGMVATLPTCSAQQLGRTIYFIQTGAGAWGSASTNVIPLGGGSATASITSGTGKYAVIYCSTGVGWRIIAAN